MHPVPDYQIISATALAAPLAVLLLASINGLLENCGQASRNAIVISKTALCIAAVALVSVLVVGPLKIVTGQVSGLAASLSFDPISSTLLVAACVISVLSAKRIESKEAELRVKDRIARWNIAVLAAVSAMILSGNASAMGTGCILVLIGLIKANTAVPGIIPVLPGSGVKTTA